VIPKKYRQYTITTTVETKGLNPETKKTEVLEDPKTTRKTFCTYSTGVHDKKGEEIYEFDILEKGTKHFIVFCMANKFFLADNHSHYYYYHYDDKDLIYYTKIGNLMLNPELSEDLDEDVEEVLLALNSYEEVKE